MFCGDNICLRFDRQDAKIKHLSRNAIQLWKKIFNCNEIEKSDMQKTYICISNRKHGLKA